MTNKLDRRKKKTRQAVYNAFIELLEKKTYSSISVQDIIDKADIGRSTFYSHFETKDDLIKVLCTEIFDHVFSEDLCGEQTHDFSKEERGLEVEITHILYHLKDSFSYIKGLLACESGELFMQYFKTYLYKIFSEELIEDYGNVPKDYVLNRITCDFAETVRWWMKNEAYTPEDISAFFFKRGNYDGK